MSSNGYGSLKDGPDLREVFHEHRLVIDGVSGPRAVPILEALQPLLIIKADKAAAALKLWANR